MKEKGIALVDILMSLDEDFSNFFDSGELIKVADLLSETTMKELVQSASNYEAMKAEIEEEIAQIKGDIKENETLTLMEAMEFFRKYKCADVAIKAARDLYDKSNKSKCIFCCIPNNWLYKIRKAQAKDVYESATDYIEKQKNFESSKSIKLS